MPEINKSFTGGKMNKDLDERLVPNGEYRDAMNIQVSTSEESDVGTVQNILGNEKACPDSHYQSAPIDTVGTISDEINDTIYWMNAGSPYTSLTPQTIAEDFTGGFVVDSIMRKTPDGCEYVFVDKYAFTSPNNEGQENTSVLRNLPTNISRQLHPGWTVTPFDYGSSSAGNTVDIVGLVSGESYSASASGNSIGNSIFVPILALLAGQPGDPGMLGGNIIYVSSPNLTLNTTNINNATIEFFDSTNANYQTNTITSITPTPLTFADGTGQTVYKLVLQNNLTLFTPNNGTDFEKIQLSTGGEIGVSYQNNPITAKVTTTGGDVINIPNNTIDVDLNSFDVSLLSVGDEIVLTYNSGFVDSINTNNNSFNYVDSNSKPLTVPSTDFTFTIPGSSSVELASDLILTTASYDSLVFQKPRVLNFSQNRYITGINIVDDMLFWTDNFSEPKKINIKNSIAGTVVDTSGNTPVLNNTLLINEKLNIDLNSNVLVREENITVIKKSPKNMLRVLAEEDTGFSFGFTIESFNFLKNQTNVLEGNVEPGDEINITLFFDGDEISGESPRVLQSGNYIQLNPSQEGEDVQEEFQVSIILNALQQNNGDSQDWTATINTISDDVSSESIRYDWVVRSETETFKNKFPRYSYRYKYKDGEYSAFAPFTNVIFKSGDFKYDVKEAFNEGMENKIVKTTLLDYTVNMPSDVVQVDLLYKESNSPAIYTIDTIIGEDLLDASLGYEVKPTQIRSVVPENQILRPFDNVPRKALAQEITANRLVYGNYVQNYDIEPNSSSIVASLVDRTKYDSSADKKSIKSLRNYTLGISYLDQYGRQSPVFTNKNSDLKVPIQKAGDKNQLLVNLEGNLPTWAAYYKVFLKDTSNEYYNLAMDRIYDAKDGNIWLSFPSSDRNKIDEETFLILKKGIESDNAIQQNNKYKVLSISNEAPDFIKIKENLWADVDNSSSATASTTLFNDGSNVPIKDSQKVSISKSIWIESEADLGDLTVDLAEPVDVCVEFYINDGTLQLVTQKYDVGSIGHEDDGDNYVLNLEKKIEEDWLSDSTNAAAPNANLSIRVYKKVSRQQAKFSGRFFVKISKDALVDKHIVQQSTKSLNTGLLQTAQLSFNYVSHSGSISGDDTANESENLSLFTSTQNFGAGAASPPGDITSSARRDHWKNIFECINAGPASNHSAWFIDAAYYAGYYDSERYLNRVGMYKNGEHVQSQQPTAYDGVGYSNGIWRDSAGDVGPAGQTYIDLSFGHVRSSVKNAGYYHTNENRLHTGTDTWESEQVGNAKKFFLARYLNNWDYGQATSKWNQRAFYEGLYDMYDDNDLIKHWRVGSPSLNPVHSDQQDVVEKLRAGSKFRFVGGTTIYVMGEPTVTYHLNYDNAEITSKGIQDVVNNYNGNEELETTLAFNWLYRLGHSVNRRVRWRIPIFDLDGNPIDPRDQPNGDDDPLSVFGDLSTTSGSEQAVNTIQFLEEDFIDIDDQVISENPAVWETEPKLDVDLDIYYEIDGTFPITINKDTNFIFAPIGTEVTIPLPQGSIPSIPEGTTVVNWDGNIVELSQNANDAGLFKNNHVVVFSRQDGSSVRGTLLGFAGAVTEDIAGNNVSRFLRINPDVSKQPVSLAWFNCFSFENGVESNRIRDDFNQVFIDKGVKASTTITEPYEQEHRKYGLIYSGLYNSTSGVNNLNQFIQAEKITKDINPTYGSIQKLHTRDSDLVTLCEDKVLKILANKDAVFNADGSPQLVATSNVLGQTIPFTGEYGISKNPESFAYESYRSYFTDKVRGSVMRLSMDGLTPISEQGMKDYFRDNLRDNERLIGSYDDKKDEYNLTLPGTDTTVSYKENVRGWVSFKSFVPRLAASCANEYYTFKQGKIYQHHIEDVDRNTFYSEFEESSFTTVLNDSPSTIKSFNTIGYTGTQSKVQPYEVTNVGNAQVSNINTYNLNEKDGWYVESIDTNKEKGSIQEFIEKEGKWYNYIRGINIDFDEQTLLIDPSTDFGSFSLQGIGEIPPNPPGGIVSVLFSGGNATMTVSNIDISGLDIAEPDKVYVTFGVSNIIAVNTNFNGAFSDVATREANTDATYFLGRVNNISQAGDQFSIALENPALLPTLPTVGDFLTYSKNKSIDTSSLVGYFADVKFNNNSKEKAELFTVTSDFSVSSR